MDKAGEEADNIFVSLLSKTTIASRIYNFLYQLSIADPGFTYKIFYSKNGLVSGYMWMISSLRADFERFGFMLCIDAMKVALNKMTWPYLAVTTKNEFNIPVVICESIVAGERRTAYEAVLKTMLKMAPKRKNTDVLCVFSDELATEDMLKNVGLVNARLFYDHYHLQQNFEKFFSPCTDLIRSNFFNMFRASSEDILEYNYREALRIVRKYGTVVTKLQNLYAKRKHYAAYIIDSSRGTRFAHSSSPAENNHSSMIFHLGSREWQGQIDE